LKNSQSIASGSNEAIAASVRQRLKNLNSSYDFQTVLVLYALERLLYRLGQSPFHQQFVLKGSLLFHVWLGRSSRPTRDVDLLGFGDSTPLSIKAIFQALCILPVQADGLEFKADSVVSSPIKPHCEYTGVRISLLAFLAGTRTRIPLQIDVGFGDAVSPAPLSTAFPPLLPFPAPQLLIYPRESVVTEKFHAIVLLGMSNTRFKDFYDLWVLASTFTFDGLLLATALQATFDRRRSLLPATLSDVVAFSPLFTTDSQKQLAWKAFLRNHQLTTDLTLLQVADIIQRFLIPVSTSVRQHLPFSGLWDQLSWSLPTSDYP
jgi:Nucleotidyl transferase AbiEii toxin, Type IV TA system